MYVDVSEQFDVFLRARPKRNPDDDDVELVEALLGQYCRWLAARYDEQDITTSEDDWIEVWDRLGMSSGDAAEITAFTFSKVPAR